MPDNALIISTLDLPTSPCISLCLPHHLDSISLYLPGNALIISTLDRVSEHPFVRQAAWDLSNPCTLALTLSRHPTLTLILARPLGTSSSSTSASPCRSGWGRGVRVRVRGRFRVRVGVRRVPRRAERRYISPITPYISLYLAVQNAAAKRCPSAWRQIEVWALGNRAIGWGSRVGQ